MGAAQAKEAGLETPDGSPISMPSGFLPPAAAAIAKQQGVNLQSLGVNVVSAASYVNSSASCPPTGETSSCRVLEAPLSSQV